MTDYAALLEDGILEDEESRYWFNMKVDSIAGLTDIYDPIREAFAIAGRDRTYSCHELNMRFREHEYKGIIIYGTGVVGEINLLTAESSGFKADMFAKRSPVEEGLTKCGRPVISYDELIKDYTDFLVVLSTRNDNDVMEKKLLDDGFPAGNILKPVSGILIGMCGNQYFDVYEPEGKEYFVDAGSFDGDTILKFRKWCGNDFGKVYGFEIVRDQCAAIAEKYRGDDRVEMYLNGLWDEEKDLEVKINGAGSYVGPALNNWAYSETDIVKAVRLDDILKDKKVTFIKMDIEGSELNALKGGERIIKEQKPKLAISVYHKKGDILHIMQYIRSIVPEYRFKVRHYSSTWMETILYARV